MKVLLTMIVVAGAAALLIFLCYEPCQCNRQIKNTEEATKAALSVSDQFRVALIARANLESIQSCLARNPSSVAARMIAAANYRLIGQPEQAAREYTKALEYDRRPELYLELGLTYLDLHRPDEAMAPLERAARFDSETLNEIPDPEIRRRIAARIGAAAN